MLEITHKFMHKKYASHDLRNRIGFICKVYRDHDLCGQYMVNVSFKCKILNVNYHIFD